MNFKEGRGWKFSENSEKLIYGSEAAVLEQVEILAVGRKRLLENIWCSLCVCWTRPEHSCCLCLCTYTVTTQSCQEWIIAGKKPLYTTVVWASGLWGRAGIFRGRFQPEPSIGFNTTDVLCSTYLFMLADENCKCFIFIWDYGMNVCLFAPEKYSHVLSYVHIWRLFFCRAYEWNTSIASTWQFRLWGLLCWHKFTYLLT